MAVIIRWVHQRNTTASVPIIKNSTLPHRWNRERLLRISILELAFPEAYQYTFS